jgi:hypothetical protein
MYFCLFVVVQGVVGFFNLAVARGLALAFKLSLGSTLNCTVH